MSTAAGIITNNAMDRLSKHFYQSSGMTSESLHQKLEQSVLRTYDAYILPHKISKSEKGIRTNLGELIRTPMDSVITIAPFPTSQLEAILQLQPPKKVIEYSGPQHYVEDNKRKEKRTRVSRPRPRGGAKNAPEVASIYHDEDQTTTMTMNKRFKSSNEEEYNDFYQEEVQEVVQIPSNFYDIAQGVFNTFWQMEFDETEVTWAFFAKINSKNCADFKLTTFAETSYSLATIKEKLSYKQYRTTMDFVYDFRQMFDNIYTYYPPNHAAYKQAFELQPVFEERWKTAVQALTSSRH